MNIDILDLEPYIKQCAEKNVELTINFTAVGCALRMLSRSRTEHVHLITWTQLRDAWPNVIEHHVNDMLNVVLTFDPPPLTDNAPRYTLPPFTVEGNGHG